MKALKELSQCGVERFESNASSTLSSAGDLVDFSEDEVTEALDKFLETYDMRAFGEPQLTTFNQYKTVKPYLYSSQITRPLVCFWIKVKCTR